MSPPPRIPKVIHYCWFGRGEKSELIQKCIASWHKYCPDWEIIEWNEDNIDINICPYATRAYNEKRWGFVPDPIRLKIIYDHGGVYLDTDVELLRPLDDLLCENAWFGYATATEIGLGLGFGAIPGHPFLLKLLNQYLEMDKNAPYAVATKIDTKIFANEYPDFAGDYKTRQYLDDILILNDIYRYEIHHYTSSWMSPRQKFISNLQKKSKFINTVVQGLIRIRDKCVSK